MKQHDFSQFLVLVSILHVLIALYDKVTDKETIAIMTGTASS